MQRQVRGVLLYFISNWILNYIIDVNTKPDAWQLVNCMFTPLTEWHLNVNAVNKLYRELLVDTCESKRLQMGAITDRFTFEVYYIITEPVRYKFRFQRIWIFVKAYLFTSLEWSTSNLCWNVCDDKTLHCFIVLITTTLQNINYTKKITKKTI